MAINSSGVPYSNPTTSKAAASTVQAQTKRAHVARFIHGRSPRGATDEQVEIALGMKHQTASARRWEMMIRGLVADSGQQVKNVSGCNATLWVVTSLMTPHVLNTGDISGFPILPQYRKQPVQRLLKSFMRLSSKDKKLFLQAVINNVR
jgi:hypothetical protein